MLTHDRNLRLRQLFWAVALSAFFAAIYTCTNLRASQLVTVPSVYLSWERHMPFVPVMIMPYMSIDLFFFCSPFLCVDRKQLRVHAMRIVFAVLVAGTIFTLAPLKYGFDRPPVESVFAPVFTLLWTADLPFNLAPSLHLALRTILWPVYVRRTSGWLRVAVKIWFIAIGVSTLLVHQHHLVDVGSGVALGFLALYLFDERIMMRQPVRFFSRAAARYFLAALGCVMIALLFPPWGVLALWPALSLALVGCAYLGVGPRVFRKLDNGQMLTAAKWVLEPYLLGQKLFAWMHTRGTPPFVRLTATVFIGRRLSVREAAAFAMEHHPVCVIDLAAEFQERPALRCAPNYANIPMLDLVPPTLQQLRAAVDAIQRYEQSGVVYVHCSMGLYRSMFVGCAYLVASGRAATAGDAAAVIRSLKPVAIRPAELIGLLEHFLAFRGSSKMAVAPADVYRLFGEEFQHCRQ